MLQNEAVDADEDIEHFEDIKENDDNQIIPTLDSTENKGHIADTKNGPEDESDSSLDEPGSAASDSEEDILNESDDLLGGGRLSKLEESKSTPDIELHNGQHQMLPGGYNPRHREPTYW